PGGSRAARPGGRGLMPFPRVLVAGIGNIFFGDDAFGCEVARQLSSRLLPAGGRVVGFGIRGLDLAYALLEGYDGAVFIDVTQRGKAPGTLYVLEPDRTEPVGVEAAIEPHALHLAKVLHLARSMGEVCGWLRIVGCEPA